MMNAQRRKITTLDNGFRIVTEVMPGLKSASLGIWVNAGCRDERKDQNGIAHFLEHMAFKGTKNRNALQIAQTIENVGGYINAYTSREMTAYYTRVLEGDVALAQDVISDIVLNSVFDSKEIEIERGVILQEIGQSLDTPDDVIFDWLQEVAYPDQAMGRPILGPSERVRAFKHDDFEKFIGQFYGPDQLVLAAAGAVDHDQVVQQAESVFGGLSPIARNRREQARFTGGEKRVIKDLEQVHFALSFESPAYRSDDFYTARLFSAIMGGGMASRLFQEVREKRGLCYSIYTNAGAFQDSGMFTIYAGSSAKDIDDLARLTVDEIMRASHDLSAEELERARTQMKAGLLMGLEGASARCERIARMLSIFGEVPKLDDIIAKIDAVDQTRIKDYIASLIKVPPAMAVYGPADDLSPIEDLSARMVA